MPSSIRVCLVGGGRAGQVHANSLVNRVAGGELVALVDRSAEVLEATGRMFGIESRFATLEQALESVKFEAVVITSPTFTHRSLAVLAAREGKHIFCEKPMALTLADCDEIITAAARSGVVLQIGFMRRFDPDFEAGWARVQDGEIGRPMMIKSLTHGPGLPPPWARELATSNGMLAEVNSHDWDTTRWFAGSNPRRVYAEVSNFKGASRGVTTPDFYDTALVQVRFENEVIASISGVCPCDYGYDSRVEIVGERGILQIGELRGQSVVICTNRDQGLVTPIFRTWPQRFAEAYISEMRHFTECVRLGRPPRVTGEDGRWAVAGVLAGTKSLLEERPVTLAEILKEAAAA